MNPFAPGDYVTDNQTGEKLRVISIGQGTLEVNLADGGIDEPTKTVSSDSVAAFVPQA